MNSEIMDRLELIRAAVQSQDDFFQEYANMGGTKPITPQQKKAEELDDFINERVHGDSASVHYQPITPYGPGYTQKRYYSTSEHKCDVCGRTFRGNNVTGHRNTRVHQAYEQMNQKLKRLVLNMTDS